MISPENYCKKIVQVSTNIWQHLSKSGPLLDLGWILSGFIFLAACLNSFWIISFFNLYNVSIRYFYIIIFLYYNNNICFGYRSETPPNTPQRARIALRNLEHAARELEGPSRRRISAESTSRNTSRPTSFLFPQITSNEPVNGPDPFAMPSASTSYSHLPVELRTQLAALSSLPNNPMRWSHYQLPPGVASSVNSLATSSTAHYSMAFF